MILQDKCGDRLTRQVLNYYRLQPDARITSANFVAYITEQSFVYLLLQR